MDNDSINDWLPEDGETFWESWGLLIVVIAIIFIMGFVTGRFFS